MKKISVILLTFILTLSLIPLQIPVSASSTADNNADIKLINDTEKLLTALDIGFDDSHELTDEISRSEFLNILMSILNYKITSDIPSHGFNDVDDSEINTKLSIAVSLGIISKAESFYPDRSVTYEEAFKMCVVALGYAMEAQIYGGYVAAAGRIDLSDGVVFTGNTPINYGDMLIILSNFMNTDIRKQTTIGDNGQFEVIKGNTPLAEYQNITKIAGTLDADSYTSLYDTALKTDKGYVSINEKHYLYDGECPVGTYVTAYVKEEGNKERIIYMTADNSSTITIPASDEPYFEADTLYWGDKSKMRLSSHTAVFYNGKAYTSYNDKDFGIESGNLTIIDNNSDKTIDAIHINEYTTARISDKNPKDELIFLVDGAGIIDLSNDDTVCKIILDGAGIDFNDIPTNAIASCYLSKDNTPTKIFISTKTVSGEVQEISHEDNTITVDSVKYSYGSYFENKYLSSLQLGIAASFMLDSDGYIAAISLTTSSMQYGYLVDLAKPQGLSDNYMAKIFTQSGTVKIYSLADKVKIDSNSGINSKNAINLGCFYNGDDVKEQLIRYQLNENDKISIIDTEYDNTDYNNDYTVNEPTFGFYKQGDDAYDSLKRYNFNGYDTTTTIPYKTSGVMVPYFTLNAYTPVFIINPDKTLPDDERFSIGTRDIFVKDQRYASNNLLPYNVVETGLTEVLVYIDSTGAGGASIDTESPYGVVAAFNEAIIPATEEKGYKISIFNGRVFEDYYIKSLTDIAGLYNDNVEEDGPYQLGAGDYIRYIADSRKIIKAIVKDFDASSQHIEVSNGMNHSNDNSILRYDFGKVYAKSYPSYLTIYSSNNTNEIADGTSYLKCINISNIGIIYDSKTKTVSPASFDDIVTYLSTSDINMSSSVLIRNKYALGYLYVIYK